MVEDEIGLFVEGNILIVDRLMVMGDIDEFEVIIFIMNRLIMLEDIDELEVNVFVVDGLIEI